VRTWVIYTLEDPRVDGVRYVGITHEEPAKRLAKHLYLARLGKTYHMSNWIRKLVADGVQPTLKVIHSGKGPGWGAVERWWIQWHRERGCQLVNSTEGGEGALGHTVSAEARAKMSAARLGKPLSPEHRAILRVRNTGKKMSREAIAKTAAFWRGRNHRAETKQKISAARLGKKGWIPTADQLERRAVAIRAALAEKRDSGWAHPNKGRPLSEETKAKMASTKKGRKHTDEAKAKAKMREAAAKRRARSATQP
jgi:hypothetical protein